MAMGDSGDTAALANSKIGNEAISIRKYIGKLKPTTASGAAAYFAEQEREAQGQECSALPAALRVPSSARLHWVRVGIKRREIGA